MVVCASLLLACRRKPVAGHPWFEAPFRLRRRAFHRNAVCYLKSRVIAATRIREFVTRSGTPHAPTAGMIEVYEDERKYAWVVYAIAALIVGALAGYIIGVEGARPSAGSLAQATASAPVTAPTAPLVDEGALRAYRDILARDPKNLQAAVNAANLLYDGRRYVEAIPFYEQAFALNSTDINVSTDLGTALWYAGRPDDALAQYERSLKISPTHAQTLYNVGIVRADGKHDYPGAVVAWESLLASSPAYPNAAAVRELLSDARGKSNIAAR